MKTTREFILNGFGTVSSVMLPMDELSEMSSTTGTLVFLQIGFDIADIAGMSVIQIGH